MTTRTIWVLFLHCFASLTPVFANASLDASAHDRKPSRVILIRHGEKDGDDPSNPELNDRGKERAQALIQFFTRDPRIVSAKQPIRALFAASPKNDDSSIRPQQTLEPLSKAISIPITLKFERNKTKKLAEYLVRYAGSQTVVIAWVQDFMEQLAEDLGVPKWEAKKWKSSIFDRAWVIQFNPTTGEFISLQDVPQKLLAGDSEN